VIYKTRFAPSPTGPLHLGHAYSAILAFERAQAAQGEFLLRIEDIDQSRARAPWEIQIYDDLKWLGLTWPAPVLRQSDNLGAYGHALDALWAAGLLYRCDCKRRDIAHAVAAPQEGTPALGPDGLIYPGTCRHLHPRIGSRPTDVTLRVDLHMALAHIAGALTYTETGQTPGLIDILTTDPEGTIGDIVLARPDMGTSYHLSVVVDDAAQNITEVIRGVDLADATRIHVILQRLLGLPTPDYHHHRLIRDAQGKRLAKRDDARAIAKYRAEGYAPDDIRDLVGLCRATLGSLDR
jgi:glutamyl-Q tRNA(Asp) synthetase